MKTSLRNHTRTLVVAFGCMAAGALIVQPVLATFSQVTSTPNTVSAAGSELSIADNNQTTFGSTVDGSLTAATGLQNNGIYKLAGFVDIKHTGTGASTYGISNPTPSSLGGANAALDSNLKVVVVASPDDPDPGADNTNSGMTYVCAGTVSGNLSLSGTAVVGSLSDSVADFAPTAFSGLTTSGHPLPANGAAKRLCFYLGLATTTPQTAAGGTAAYGMTLTHN